MKRNYTDRESDEIRFFVGVEVEHTPAFGKKTLFVIGTQTEQAIMDTIKDLHDHKIHIDHVYFGANQSFPITKLEREGWFPWEEMVMSFLTKGYLCTLDIDVTHAEDLTTTRLCEFNNFIPMISVKLPYVQLLGYNATIKLDDKDFRATNPGVWCHSIHSLMDRTKFTDWSKYTQDQVVK